MSYKNLPPIKDCENEDEDDDNSIIQTTDEYMDVSGGHEDESSDIQYGPEPDILNSRDAYFKTHPDNTYRQYRDPSSHKNSINTDTPLRINPNYTKFSLTLLLWVIALVVFIISYFAIRYNGLFCDEPMNNATIIRKGLMLSDMEYIILSVYTILRVCMWRIFK